MSKCFTGKIKNLIISSVLLDVYLDYFIIEISILNFVPIYQICITYFKLHWYIYTFTIHVEKFY